MLKPDDYRTEHRIEYKAPDPRCYTSISVLTFLWGQPWDQLALNYVHGLRPSTIRVNQGCVTCDCDCWRVSVWLENDDRTIHRITQEIEAGGVPIKPDGDTCCGEDLSKELFRRGINPRS